MSDWPLLIVIPGRAATFQKAVMTWHSKDGRSGTHAYDKASYRQWRDYARGRTAEICQGREVTDAAVCVQIAAYFLPPKSLSKKAFTAAVNNLKRPTTKPDPDNIAKAVADSCLKGLVIRDDNQIVHLQVDKYFSQEQRVEINVSLWNGEGDST